MVDRVELLIRADAGPTIGAGHIMRCLALAQAWSEEGGSVKLVARGLSPGLRQRFLDEGGVCVQAKGLPGSLADARNLAEYAAASDAVVVIDGYGFGHRYQAVVREKTRCLMVIDDHCTVGHYDADLILDQNIGANAGAYADSVHGGDLLLGTEYVLLRREFGQVLRASRQWPNGARKILVTLGGTDHRNMTRRVVRGLEKIGPLDLKIKVVLGPSSSSLLGFRKRYKGLHRIEFVGDVIDMAGEISNADIAVSASGSTCWELCCLGTPSVVFAIADNQEPVGRRLHEAGAVVFLGQNPSSAAIGGAIKGLVKDQRGRRSLGERGMELVDGNGARRVVGRLLECWSH